MIFIFSYFSQCFEQKQKLFHQMLSYHRLGMVKTKMTSYNLHFGWPDRLVQQNIVQHAESFWEWAPRLLGWATAFGDNAISLQLAVNMLERSPEYLRQRLELKQQLQNGTKYTQSKFLKKYLGDFVLSCICSGYDFVKKLLNEVFKIDEWFL